MRTHESIEMTPLQRQVTALLSSARAAFGSDERVGMLELKLPVFDDSPLRIALAGPFNAGKTMLISALLKLPPHEVDELTAATPKTSGVTPYAWQDCALLDLPGTLSGLEEHDLEAAAGMRQADVLLLVTSVELPGEAETRQIERLLSEEGFGRRCIVVVNKCNAEENDPGIIRDEMQARMAAYPHVQVLFTDARDYLDSLNFPDLEEHERALLREDSGIVVLEEALESFVSDLVGAARLHAICHEIRRACDEAISLWEPDPNEESLEVAADRIRFAFANARAELSDAIELALGTLQDEITGAGGILASAVSAEDGSVSTTAAATADERLGIASQRYQDDATKAIDDVVKRLLDQLGRTSHEWERYDATTRAAPTVANGPTRAPVTGKGDELVDRVLDAGTGLLKRKFEAVIQGGVRPGSPAHDLARKVNGLLRRTPKAHVHIKMAEKLTKLGRGASTAAGFIAPVSDLKGIVDNLRRGEEIKKQREKIRSTYSEHAQAVSNEERQCLDDHIQVVLEPIQEAVAETLAAADERISARRTAQARFAEVGDQARELSAVIEEDLVAHQSSATP